MKKCRTGGEVKNTKLSKGYAAGGAAKQRKGFAKTIATKKKK